MSRFLDALRVNNTIDKSWEAFFKDQYIVNELDTIEKKLFCNYTPSDRNVLRFATVDLRKVKVIILGKDPYPQKGVATGRSFEVANITSWCDKELKSSLRNILKLIHKSELNKSVALSIQKIRDEIKGGKFTISKKPNEIFDYWEEQGVLCINCAFTCEMGDNKKSGSHLKLWENFFEKLLEYIINNNNNIEFFLWGYSRKYKNKLNNMTVYPSKHPSSRGSDDINKTKKARLDKSNFLLSDCFKRTKGKIKWI